MNKGEEFSFYLCTPVFSKPDFYTQTGRPNTYIHIHHIYATVINRIVHIYLINNGSSQEVFAPQMT